ncbi:MAG: right-handed parallel beta-helix repeat-containing protein [Planctomycetota bacterium]|jgi:hypothetical protein
MKKCMRKVMETGREVESKLKTKHERRTSREWKLLYPACVVVLAILLLSPMLVHAGVNRFVHSSAPLYGGFDQGNDCRNRSRPCQTIQHAIDVADDRDIIKVAQGGYEENIVMNKGIVLTIEGGYFAYPYVSIELNFLQRCPSPCQLTSISGPDRGSIVTIEARGNYVGMAIDRVILTGGEAVSGGAISISATSEEEGNFNHYGGEAWLRLKNSIIFGNTADEDGGAIYAEVHSRNKRLCTVGLDLSDNLIFGNNASRHGGAISLKVQRAHDAIDETAGHIRMKRNRIQNNTATGVGGGISVYGGNTTQLYLENNIIAGNTASTGAGIYATSIAPPPGSLYYEIFLSLLNDTITDNISSEEGSPWGHPPAGVFVRGFEEVELVNVILWGNHGGEDIFIDGGLDGINTITKVSYSDIGTADISGTYSEGAGNVNVDPQFVDPDADAGDYHLRSDSPLLDAGICGLINRMVPTRIAPHEDFEGDLRPFPGDLQCESRVYFDRYGHMVCGQGLYLGCSIGADDEYAEPEPKIPELKPIFQIDDVMLMPVR